MNDYRVYRVIINNQSLKVIAQNGKEAEKIVSNLLQKDITNIVSIELIDGRVKN